MRMRLTRCMSFMFADTVSSDYQKGSQDQMTRRSNRMPSVDLSDLSDQSDCDEQINTDQELRAAGNDGNVAR